MGKLNTRLRRFICSPNFWVIAISFGGFSVFYYSWPWSNWSDYFRVFAITEYSNHILGSLFLIPMFYAGIVYKWRGALSSGLLCMVITVPLLVKFSPDIKSMTFNIAFLLLPLLIVLLVTAQLTWREMDRRNMREREKERQVYIAQIVGAQEDERMRIAHELHDDTTQALLVIANRTQTLVSNESIKADPDMTGMAEWIRDATIQVCENVRRLSMSLRPSVLDNLGLVPALRSLARQMKSENNIDTVLMVEGEERHLSPEAEINVFRIVQEALANIKRHSRASLAKVHMRFFTNSIKIEIEDNGRGFALEEVNHCVSKNGKLGLLTMRQRAELINGKLNVSTKIGKGTLISVVARC